MSPSRTHSLAFLRLSPQTTKNPKSRSLNVFLVVVASSVQISERGFFFCRPGAMTMGISALYLCYYSSSSFVLRRQHLGAASEGFKKLFGAFLLCFCVVWGRRGCCLRVPPRPARSAERCVTRDWKYSGVLGYFMLKSAVALTPDYKLTFWKSSAAVEP